MRYLSIVFALWATSTTAEAPDLNTPMICAGSDPDWSLSIDGDAATFSLTRDSDLSLMLSTPAEGRDWPIALTFIGRGDSVIALLDDTVCPYGDTGTSIEVLTQRGQTPLLLTGCCQPSR